MPVVEVRSLPLRSGVDVSLTLKKLNSVIAQIVGVPERSVWSTWQCLATEHYFEGSISVTEQPLASHPPLVKITLFEGRSAEVIERTLVAMAEVIVEGFKIEAGNVFISVHEARSGQLYTGGKIRKRTLNT